MMQPPRSSPSSSSSLIGDLIIAGIALALSLIVLLALPVDVPGAGLHSLTDMASPAFFPLLAALLVGTAGAALGLSAWLKHSGHRSARAGIAAPRGRVLACASGCVMYIPLIHALGMITASALAFCFIALVFGWRGLAWLLALAVAIPAVVYLLFGQVLKIQFPPGALF